MNSIIEICTAHKAIYRKDPSLEKYYFQVSFDQVEKKLGVKLDRRRSYMIWNNTISIVRKNKTQGRIVDVPPIISW